MALASAELVDPEVQARAVLDATVKVLGAERGFILMPEEPGAPLKLRWARSIHRKDLSSDTPYSTTAVARVHESGQPLVVTGTEEGALLGSQSAVAQGLRSIIAAPRPLVAATGSLMATFLAVWVTFC